MKPRPQTRTEVFNTEKAQFIGINKKLDKLLLEVSGLKEEIRAALANGDNGGES